MLGERLVDDDNRGSATGNFFQCVKSIRTLATEYVANRRLHLSAPPSGDSPPQQLYLSCSSSCACGSCLIRQGAQH